MIAELTRDGPMVLLASGKAAKIYAFRCAIGMSWPGARVFLKNESVFDSVGKVYYGANYLFLSGLGGYWASADPYQPLVGGWHIEE